MTALHPHPDEAELRDALARLRTTLEAERLPWLDERRLDGLQLALAEATRNAIEHGHQDGSPEPVELELRVDSGQVRVRITDQGAGIPPATLAHVPDPARKLRGEEAERGWGVFLVRRFVDEVLTRRDHLGHHLELVLRAEPPA